MALGTFCKAHHLVTKASANIFKIIICSYSTPKKQGRPPYGNRPLTDPSKVFLFNNWDNVEWDDEQEAVARKKVHENSQKLVEEDKKAQYEAEADRFWDEFYTQHQNRFFKDRHWLFTEFPELLCGMGEKYGAASHEKVNADELIEGIEKKCEILDDISIGDMKNHQKTQILQAENVSINIGQSIMPGCDTQVSETDCSKESKVTCDNSETIESTQVPDFPGQNAKSRIFEVGCGVGNTVFPVLQTNNDPGVFVYCCDLSSTAIQLVKEHKDYDEKRCHAFVCDVTDDSQNPPFPENSLDVITLIFVMSAIHPEKMQGTINRLAKALKPGGILLFRDYGRYDMAQLRFKNGRCLSENFYVRGDGTRVYFFTQEELKDMFTNAGLVEKQNYIDRRLQVNRGKMLKMYRVWIQCKYQKIVDS